MINLDIPSALEDAVKQYRYNNLVFILSPWEEIYMTDNERKQDYDTAVQTYNVMKSIYIKLGYNPIEVPKTTVEKRVEFLLEKIGLI